MELGGRRINETFPTLSREWLRERPVFGRGTSATLWLVDTYRYLFCCYNFFVFRRVSFMFMFGLFDHMSIIFLLVLYLR